MNCELFTLVFWDPLEPFRTLEAKPVNQHVLFRRKRDILRTLKGGSNMYRHVILLGADLP